MSMKKLLIMKAVGKVAATYGDKWARMAGDKAVARLSRMAAEKGYLQKTYDLRSLTEELKVMHQEGRFTKQEWTRVKELLRQAWQNRNKPK
jgi:CDP-glycerol glycerophosphotransferase (TagB/SpsB family)